MILPTTPNMFLLLSNVLLFCSVYFSVANSVEAHKSYPGIYFKVSYYHELKSEVEINNMNPSLKDERLVQYSLLSG